MNARISLDIDPNKRTIGRSLSPPKPRATRSMAMMGAVLRGIDRLSPALGARAAARVFLTPRNARVPERETAWLRKATKETFTAGRFRLAGHRWSESGKRVLLVHGWEGRGSQLGGLALALAERGLQPLTIDLPAHGASPGKQTNLLEFAESVGGMVKQLGGVLGIVAHSFGAAGTTVALREALPIERFVYLAPTEDFEHYPTVFGEWFSLSDSLRDRMKRSVEGRLGTTMAEIRGVRIAPHVKAPLLVVHDEDDVDVPLRDGRAYAEAWPGARLHATRGLGHRRILRDPEVLRAVADFFAPETGRAAG